MSVVADFRMLWDAAVVQRHPRQMGIARRMVPLLMLVVAACAIAMTGDWARSLGYALRVPFAVLMYFAVVLFVPGAALLNTPVNARLAPRIRRRQMQMAGLGWFAGAAVPALVLGTSTSSSLIWFLGIGIWIIGFGVARSGYLVGAGLQMVAVIGTLSWREHLTALNTPGVLALGAVALVAAGAGALKAIFPRGGERHWKLHGKLERTIQQHSVEGQFKSGEVWRVGANLYGSVLRRDCAQRRSGALLLHVLGATTHWTQLGLQLGALLATVLLAKLLLASFASAGTLDTAAGMGWALMIPLLFMQQINLERVLMRLAVTSEEQALLRMAPLSAPAAQFNRQLGRALLRHALLDWAAISAAIMCATALTGASASILLMQACLCCLGLPLVAALLRNHARHTGPLGWWGFLSGNATVALSGAAGWFAFRLLELPGWPVMALANVVLAVLIVRWRWRMMVRAPVAFPVGRLA